MTGTRPDRDEAVITLGLDESIEIDVRYCDVVLARPDANTGPHDVRFRGTRHGDGLKVRLFLPLAEIEGPMVHEGVLAQAITLGRVDRTNSQEVKLTKYALRISRVAHGSRWRYRVEPLKGDGDRAVKRLQEGVTQAMEHVAPLLQQKGYAVGAPDIISIAGQLDAMRHSQE